MAHEEPMQGGHKAKPSCATELTTDHESSNLVDEEKLEEHESNEVLSYLRGMEGRLEKSIATVRKDLSSFKGSMQESLMRITLAQDGMPQEMTRAFGFKKGHMKKWKRCIESLEGEAVPGEAAEEKTQSAAPEGVTGTMDWVDDDHDFVCLSCGTHICRLSDLVSEGYKMSGNKTGFLFRKGKNVSLGDPSSRSFTSGNYTVSEASCINCSTYLGYQYVSAELEKNQHKVGRMCLRRDLLLSPDQRRSDAPLDFTCKKCTTFIFRDPDVQTRNAKIDGDTGYIVSAADNVNLGSPQEISLKSGMYTTAQVTCSNCDEYFGLKYLEAADVTNSLKVGKFLLKRSMFMDAAERENGYSCKQCNCMVGFENDVEGRGYVMNGMTAFLFCGFRNVDMGTVQAKRTTSGLYEIRPVTCSKCSAYLGWMYESANDPSNNPSKTQKFIGKYLVAREAILSSGDRKRVA